MVIFRLTLFFYFILSFSLNSCSINRNDKGQIRINESRFKLNKCINDNTYKIIDTSSLYIKIKSNNNYKAFVGNKDSVFVKDMGIYLKFYDNGKVGMFQNLVDLKVENLNPKYAIMGYYCIDGKNNQQEFVFNHIQSGNFISRDRLEIKNDTITSYTIETSTGGGHYNTYVKKNLPKEFLIYKPDW